MTATLSIPTPSLQLEPPGPGMATLEKPVTIISAPVLYPDGRQVTDQVAAISGFLLYRQTPYAAGSQVWDSEQKTWRAGSEAVSLTLQPKPLLFKGGGWEGLFLGPAENGAVEAGGNLYSFRTLFRVRYLGSTLAAVSQPSAQIRFVAAADAMQAGIKIESPETATEITIYLRNAAKQNIGTIHLLNDGGSARIDIANSTGAFVRVASNGDVVLQPATGRSVIVRGHLRTDTLHVEHP